MQGTGGLDLVNQESQPDPDGVVADLFGHVLGRITNGAVVWSPTRFSGYGPLPGYESPALSLNVPLVTATGWRSRRVDETGLMWLGARYYDPVAGRFLSADPLGHVACPDLYSGFNGDPVNLFDPDGRFGKAAFDYAYSGGSAGANLRALGGYLDAYNNSGTGGGWFTGFAGSVADELADMSAPSTYVNGLQNYGNNVSTAYQDGGLVRAGSYALTSWNMGAVMGSIANQNQITGEPLGDWIGPRGTEFSSGVAGTAGVAAGGLGLVRGYLPVGESPPGPIYCFPAGTQVLLADGTAKAIEQIRVGDRVLAGEPNRASFAEPRAVVQTHTNWTQRLVQIAVDQDGDGRVDGEFQATGEHPIWTQNRGWVNAVDLTRGDRLVGAEEQEPLVLSAGSSPILCATYNLSVEGSHTFFVLAGGMSVLVHNTEPALILPYGNFPAPNPAGMQNHHIVQDAWVRVNHPDYGALNLYNRAPAIQLQVDPTHYSINAMQRDFRAGLRSVGQDPYGTSLSDELNSSVRWMREAGVPENDVRRAAKAAYKFFDTLPEPPPCP
jgi:RHS repeat-associated protein